MSIPNISAKENFVIKESSVKEDIAIYNRNTKEHYELGKRFRSGGQATLFDLIDKENPNAALCLKVININKKLNADDTPEDVLRRYAFEINNLQKLNGHKNVVTTFGFFASPDISYKQDSNGNYAFEYEGNGRGYLYIIMEKLTPLNDYIESIEKKMENSIFEKQKQLSILKKLTIDICLALAACEDNDILHRDIAEKNILIRKTGNDEPDFVLADFGVSRTGIIGHSVTFYYIEGRTANEICKRRVLRSYNSDIHMLGRMIRELLMQFNIDKSCPGFVVFDKVIAKSEIDEPELRYINAIEMLEDLKDKLSYDYAKKLFCDSEFDEAMNIAYKVLKTSKNQEEKINCRRLIAIIKHNKAYDGITETVTDHELFDEALNEMYKLAYQQDVKASFFYFLYWYQSCDGFKRKEFDHYFKFLKYSVENNYAFAQYVYGVMLYEGEILNKDEKLGFDYIMKAVEQNCYDAKCYIINNIAGKNNNIDLRQETIRTIKEDIKDENIQRIKDRKNLI